METITTEKKTKTAVKGSKFAAVRVHKDTGKKFKLKLDEANKKDFGRKVRADQLMSLAVSLIKPEHLQALQEATLSYMDKRKMEHKAYSSQFGSISLDEFLSRRDAGTLEIQKGV